MLQEEEKMSLPLVPIQTRKTGLKKHLTSLKLLPRINKIKSSNFHQSMSQALLKRVSQI
jgi:hypothetical protein